MKLIFVSYNRHGGKIARRGTFKVQKNRHGEENKENNARIPQIRISKEGMYTMQTVTRVCR